MYGVKEVPLAVYIVRAEKKMSRAEDTNHCKKKKTFSNENEICKKRMTQVGNNNH